MQGGILIRAGSRIYNVLKANIKKTDFNVNNIESFSAYDAVNELPFGYKTQSVNVVQGNNRSLV
jgi:hypothetical protein